MHVPRFQYDNTERAAALGRSRLLFVFVSRIGKAAPIFKCIKEYERRLREACGMQTTQARHKLLPTASVA